MRRLLPGAQAARTTECTLTATRQARRWRGPRSARGRQARGALVAGTTEWRPAAAREAQKSFAQPQPQPRPAPPRGRYFRNCWGAASWLPWSGWGCRGAASSREGTPGRQRRPPGRCRNLAVCAIGTPGHTTHTHTHVHTRTHTHPPRRWGPDRAPFEDKVSARVLSLCAVGPPGSIHPPRIGFVAFGRSLDLSVPHLAAL